MAKDFDPKKFQSFFEKIAESNVKAFEAQTRYFESLMKRNTELMTELTSARIDNLKELASNRDLSNAVDNTSAFSREMQEKMQKLYEENMEEWESLQEELKELYAIDNELMNQMQQNARNMVSTAREKVKGMVSRGESKPASKPRAKKAPTKE